MDIVINSELSLLFILILVGVGFTAGFVDSIAGGGGLISLPGLLLLGIPPTMALGTNKLASSFGTMVSFLTFYRQGKIDKPLMKILFPISFAFACGGAYLATRIPTPYLKPIIISFLVSTTVFILLKKDWGVSNTYADNRRSMTIGVLVATICGFYDGFVGPGTGTFLVFAFIYMGFDFVMAAGNAKAVNLASNLAALGIFIVTGHVNYIYALFMMAGTLTGSFFGARLAILKGSKFVRIIFILVSCTMIGKLLIDYILTL